MKKGIFSLFIMLFFTFSEATSAHNSAVEGVADSPWPMYQHDPQHTGRSPFLGPLQNPELLWVYQMPRRIDYALAPLSITSQGDIITPSGGTLQSIDPINHTSNWIFSQGGYSLSTPLISTDGSIFWGKGLDYYKITPLGQQVWSVWIGSTNFAFNSSSTFGKDGNIYFVHDGIFSVSADGFPRWGYWYSYYASLQSPAIGPDGTIYAPGIYDLSAYASNGEILWSIITSRPTRFGTSLIGEEGIIYIPSDNGLYAINPDSTIRWQFTVPDEDYNGYSITGTALAEDGTIYGLMFRSAPEDNSLLYAVSPDGQMKWKARFSSNVITGKKGISNLPLISDKNGNVYLCLENSRCYGFGPDGTKLWEYEFPLVDSIEILVNEPILAADGLFYVSDQHSKLYAFADPDIYPTLSTSVKELSFEVGIDAPVILSTIPVTSTLQPISYTVTITPTNWLNVNEISGITPSQVNLMIDPAGLSPGKYKGNLSIRTTGRVGKWIDIPIKLVVTKFYDHGSSVYLPSLYKEDGSLVVYHGPSRIIYQRQYFLDRQLVSMDTEGENLKILAQDLPQINEMAATADGLKIALACIKDNKLFIRILDGVTGNQILEVMDAFENRNPAFSPTGDQVLFVSNRDELDGELYRIDLDGSNLTRLTYNKWQETSFFWSPDAGKIALGLQWSSTYLMNPDGTDLQKLESPFSSQEPLGWSPDGQFLLIKFIRDGSSTPELGIYDLQSRKFKYVDKNIKQYGRVAWSPSGNAIAYLKGTYNNWALVVFRTDSGEYQNVMESIPHTSSEGPYWSWSLDGEWIAISRLRGDGSGSKEIFVVNLNGSIVRILTTNTKDDDMPFWQYAK